VTEGANALTNKLKDSPYFGKQYSHRNNDTLCIILTRCSAIAERPRCRVRYSFRQK